MAGKKRGKSGKEHESATEASTTAVELNPKQTPSVDSFNLPDTGTPLPDDPKVLKENVKGLKSQLRRHKLQVVLHSASTVRGVYTAAVGKWIRLLQEEVLIPIGNH